jgi:chemotaxis protein methyltransferase CheR
MIHLLPQERNEVTQYIYSLCSIALDASKDYLIEGRLNRLLEETGSRSFAQLVQLSRSDTSGALKRRIVDDITTGETLFFRDRSPFELLQHKIVPEILDRRARAGSRAPIRVWSAACSTGQEIYSIAIVVKELLGDLNRFGIRLLGTDISDQAVARASAGIFGPVEIARGLDDATRTRYFVPHAGGGWRIRDEIRAMASFRRLNLMEDLSSLGKFDIIFCRNVAIYFNDRDRVSLFNRLGQRMEGDGCLVIGSMESLSGICPQFESKRHLRSVYYQIKSAPPNGIAA